MPLIFLPIKHIFHLLCMLLHHDLNLNAHITYWTPPLHDTYTGSSHYMFKMQIQTRQLYLQHMDKFQTVIMQTYKVKCSMTRGYFYTRSSVIQTREVIHSSVMWHCFTDYLVPKILRQHNGPIFNPRRWHHCAVWTSGSSYRMMQHHPERADTSLSLSLTHTHTHTRTHTRTHSLSHSLTHSLSLLQKPKNSRRSENIGIFVILRVFFYSCVDGNSQDPERERRPFSRPLAIPMVRHTHTTCVSTGCKRELLLASA